MDELRKWMGLCEIMEDAWHASPHLFDKFRTGAASGEGGQSYGYGLYFTDSKGVADWYKAQFIRRFGKNYTYRVTLPDDGYLLWEAPLTGQSDKVKKIAKAAYNFLNGSFVITRQEEKRREGEVKVWFRWQLFKSKVLIRTGYAETEEAATLEAKSMAPGKAEYMGMDGEKFYRELQQGFARRDGGSTQGGAYQRQVSDYLRTKGLIGIKYLNGFGTGYNYVIFSGDEVSMDHHDNSLP